MREYLLHRVYLCGYQGRTAPRWARRVMAKTEAHRAWFLGFHGYFEEDGTRHGLAHTYPSTREG